MEKYAWRAQILKGKEFEYQQRHDAIWPELVDVLKQAGIRNYSIWRNGCELFGYYECEYGVDFASKVQSESDIVAKWDSYMKDVLIMETDPQTGAQPLMEKVFELD